ncbi:hypothetical protein GCM10027610_046110 [Dactylosporangium cerinum]
MATAATDTVPAVSGVSGVPVQVMCCWASAGSAAAESGMETVPPIAASTAAAAAETVLTGPRLSRTPNAAIAVSPSDLRLEGGGSTTRRPAVEDRNGEL